MQNAAQKKHAVAQWVGLDIWVAHHAKSATRAKSLYNMLELRKGGPLVSQGRTDAATWLFLCTVGEIGCFYRDG